MKRALAYIAVIAFLAFIFYASRAAASPTPVPIPRDDAVSVSEAAISAVAWDMRTGRWRVAYCTRRSALRWDCMTNVNLHAADGWVLCAVRVKVYVRSRRDPGIGGWPRWSFGRQTCASPTPNPTLPNWRPS